MEILAPAGNMDALIAAVRSGADAVYLGLKDFSARRNADNFTKEEFIKAAKYCHIRGVKVYLTLNTMIKESELSSAVDTAVFAYKNGADAFIVSDLGLISVLHKLLPEATLHASTQMTVHSPAAISALKKYGIKRVVLAREMSKGEIKEFCEAAKKENIEVEVFVHGALCMCVSGQCLLSSMLGGRSGNRGLCAGPCRLEFSAKDTGRYDLSLKDLSLVSYLKELKEMGITSAKIEGRMKRPEYVSAAVTACKSSLAGKAEGEEKSALEAVFSRSGFTDGYYTGNLGADMFGIRTKEDVLSSAESFSYIHSLYRNERQCVPIKIFAEIKSGKSITVELSDYINTVIVSGAMPEPARNKSTTAEDVKTSLSRLGGTPYFAKETAADVENGVFVSAAALNNLRREAVEKLNCRRAKVERESGIKYMPQRTAPAKPEQQKIYIRISDPAKLPKDCSGLAAVILPYECDFSALPESIEKIADLPRYIADEKAVTKRLCELKKQGVNKACCGNLSAVELALKAGFYVIASNGLNTASGESLAALKELGADECVLSAETNISDAKNISAGIKKGIFAYGRLPLMLTRNCPIKNAKTCAECGKWSFLTDRKGMRFPVACRQGYSELLNSSPLYLADKQNDLAAFDFLLLYFTDETPGEIDAIIENYRLGKPADGNFTRGLYYKNLI